MEPSEKRTGFRVFWRKRARELKTQTLTLYLAYRDARTPWYAKGFALLVVAYAFSPIDLIPDFVPVLGYLDDLVLIPLGVLLVVKMIPNEVLDECRAKAAAGVDEKRPEFRFMAVVVVVLWLAAVVLVGVTIWRMVGI